MQQLIIELFYLLAQETKDKDPDIIKVKLMSLPNNHSPLKCQ